ncbi:MAG TPA: helix-turn-helix transcriptional regulator [Acidimicrobiia bacterium]|nr:helix-turn-helix transcriptional regulator [Acidimicrobiia bacterium]
MTDRGDLAFGAKIRELRREAGLDQRGLADVLKRSVSWVSQVERGEIVVGDVGMLQRLAVALGVPSRELVELVLGADAGEAERQRPHVEVLRLALAGHPAPREVLGLPAPEEAPPSIDEMERQVGRAWELVHASAFEELGPLLATLIPKLEATSRRVDDAERGSVVAALADAYQIAAAMLVKVGDLGAAWLAADRAISAGERCGDRALVMAGELRMAHTFVNAQERDLAIHVLRQAVEISGALSADTDFGIVSLTGGCALLLAVLEARQGRSDEARRHLKVAENLAKRLGGDRNDYGTEFGPTNVKLHQVAVAVELGNAAEALDLARRVDPAALSPERQARFLVDVARAHAQRRAVASAVATLADAERIAPAEIRESRRVRELIGDLEHMAGGRAVPGLRALRRRATHN